MPPSQIKSRLNQLFPSPTDLASAQYLWEFWARPEQLAPAAFANGLKTYWLILAGRGFGKTRSGAEQVRKWARTHRYVNLIGPTADDARDAMIEGESGILAICPEHERPNYVKHESALHWPNGCKSLIFTADVPDRLRNKQHEKLWADEVAAWRYPESWDQAQFGLRLGRNPQAVITTTPRPTKLVREIAADPSTILTRGTSYDNRDNLAEAFYASIVRKYEGTRIGRQELNAEILDDNPGALWTRAIIDANRVRVAPPLSRVVVGLDPAVTSREDSDETGIIAAGRGPAPEGWKGVAGAHLYILDDRSLIASPDAWARCAVKCYHENKADRIIGEVNNGGEMVGLTIRAVDPNAAFEAVTASRGKMIRAEPIAALYEQGRVHHVGAFPKLEDQLCEWNPLTSERSPDRLDAAVWACTKLADTTGQALLDFMQQAAAGAMPAVALTQALTHTAPGLRFDQLGSKANGERHT